MPIWLRRFTFNKLKEFYNKENKENDKAYNKAKKSQTARPNIKPTYSTKASR